MKVALSVVLISLLSACTSSSTLDKSSNLNGHVYEKPYKQVFIAAQDTAMEMGWQILSSNLETGIISAKASANLLTWGQDVSIIVRKVDGKEVKVDISSSARNQLVDMGRSSSDIREFYKKLNINLR